jgi:pimeloyl-ACP methyl ester carboxylesterase
MARLEDSRCIALDMPGHGGSEAFDFDGVDLRTWHVRLLTSCLDELGLQDAHFIGHSYGAMFALWLALASPERVRSIVVVGTPSIALGARPDLLLSMLARPLIGRTMLSAPMTLGTYRTILSLSLGSRAVRAAPPELIRATYLASRQRGFALTVSSYMRAQLRTESRERYVLSPGELGQLACPILILWGMEDRRYQLPEEGRRVASLIPTARFETVPGGHEPWFDDVDACTNPIADSLGSVSRRRNPASAG